MKHNINKDEIAKRIFFQKPISFAVIIICIYIVILVCGSFSPAFGAVIVTIISGLTLFFCFHKSLRFENVEKSQLAVEDFKQIVSSDMIENVPLPYAVTNSSHQILHCNQAFRALFEKKIQKNMPLNLLIADYKKTPMSQKIRIGEQYFQLFTKVFTNEEVLPLQNAYSICLTNITSIEHIKRNMEGGRTVAALIFIDNYEEVMDNMEDTSIPLLTALIDRKLNTLASHVGGIVRKFEKDRYLFLLTQEKLEELMDKKFELLNEVREINIGEHIPVTLSIGIGAGAETLDAAMKSARAAVDLALGRGGDQVLIKDGEKYLFYGGKSGEVSHNSRIRARVKADALSELIAESSEVFTMGHAQADLDCLGASIGICKIAKTLGKDCYIILDQISVGVQKLYERLVENGLDNLFITSAKALETMTSKTLLVIADTHRYSILENGAVLDKANKVVVFDHHRKSTDFIENAVLFYHEPYASSTCELVTEIIQYIGEKIRLKPIEADALLAGITVDTKNFFVKTGAITFEAAAYLRRNGADSVKVRLLFQNDMNAYKAKAAAVNNAELFLEHFAISVCADNAQNTSLTAAQTADDLLNVSGIKASFVLCQLKNKIYISARSFGDINVQVILEKLGGGGHQTVSGVQLLDADLNETKEKLKMAIKDYLQEVN